MPETSIPQKLKKIEAILPSWVSREGCSEQRLEELRRVQNVYCLPELFRQILLLIGEAGLGKLLYPEGPWEDLEKLKEKTIEDIERLELDYPEDAFFFHENYSYGVRLFFRTRDCEDDPAIYGVDWRCFFKEADSLSEYLLRILDPQKSSPFRTPRMDYYYDPSKDDFYDLSIPADPTLRMKKAAEIIFHRYGNRLVGCSEDEIALLEQAQNVAFLPETYRQFLRMMGKSGMDWVLYGRTTYEFLKHNKEEFIAFANYVPDLKYPQNIFVFLMDHHQRYFAFFRTDDDDPPVYGCEGQNWFYKLADSLSEFVLQELDANPDQITERWEKRHQTAYCYDVLQDKFVQCSMS